MCSSPKSSGNAKPSNIPVTGVFASVSQSSREHFAAVANAAEDRREQRRIIAKERLIQKRANEQRSLRKSRKSSTSEKHSPLAWMFKKDLLSFLAK